MTAPGTYPKLTIIIESEEYKSELDSMRRDELARLEVAVDHAIIWEIYQRALAAAVAPHAILDTRDPA